eukprot:19356-Pelagomonas_calceolata.AAC.1
MDRQLVTWIGDVHANVALPGKGHNSICKPVTPKAGRCCQLGSRCLYLTVHNDTGAPSRLGVCLARLLEFLCIRSCERQNPAAFQQDSTLAFICRRGGYLVEAADGLCLAAFTRPSSAISYDLCLAAFTRPSSAVRYTGANNRVLGRGGLCLQLAIVTIVLICILRACHQSNCKPIKWQTPLRKPIHTQQCP